MTAQGRTVAPQLEQFLSARPVPFHVAGQERTSTATFDVFNPSDGSVLASVAAADEQAVDDAVAAARRAMTDPAWCHLAPSARADLLWRLSELVLRDRDILVTLDAMDCGLPAHVSHQVDAVVEDLRYYAGWTSKLDGRVIPVGMPGFHVYTESEPIGVCVGITTWNFPLESVSGKAGPALATGNAIILKPSEHAPLSALWMARLAIEAGFPPGVLSVLTGGPGVGERLVAHPGVDKVAFTGSSDVGRKIAEAAGRGLKRVTVELGGKSPALVFPDADLEPAARGIAEAVFGHSGQNCVAPSRVLVHEEAMGHLLERLCDRARSMVHGPALHPDSELGPVISAARRDTILEYVRQARDAGGVVHCGGATPQHLGDVGGWYVAPTVITGVDTSAPIAREEVFGPVTCLFPFSDLEQALSLANDSEYGLSASIWTNDIATAQICSNRLDAGVVWVNGHALYDSAASFGGFRTSGYGRELGEESLREYTRVKTVWQGRVQRD